MNLHPVFVHFPIALLSVYVFFECLRWRVLVHNPTWLVVKTSFLILGTLGTFGALVSGSAIEDQFSGIKTRALISVHETMAYTTTIVFGLLTLAYIIELLDQYFAVRPMRSIAARLWAIARGYRGLIMRPYLLLPVVMIAFVALTVTGALGGALVYGPDVDPLVSFVYKLLVK